MIKILLLFILLLSVDPPVLAANQKSPVDTLDAPGNHKLSKEEFLKTYGDTQESKSLIKRFFKARKLGSTLLWIGGSVVAAALLILAALATAISGYGVLLVVIPLAIGIVGLVVSLVGLLLMVGFNRKKLLRKLREGRGSPERHIP